MEEQISPQTQASLDQITNEVYARTGGDIYGTEPQVESLPPAEPAAEQPAATPEQPPVTEPTSTPAPLVFGKYKTLEDAERGYYEAVRMGNEAKSRLDTVGQVVSPGPTPAEVDPLDAIENYGVPKELIANAIDSRTKAAINEYFRPAIQISQADREIIQAYPDYAEKFTEIEQNAQGNPAVWGQIEALNNQGNYLAARQIAYLNWKVSSAQQAVETKAAVDVARVEEAKDARRDAGVGASRRADTRTTPDVKERTPEEEQHLLDLYKRGHPQPYLRAKFGHLLGPEFDNAAALLG